MELLPNHSRILPWEIIGVPWAWALLCQKGRKLVILDLDQKFDHHLEKVEGTKMVQAQIHMMIGGPSNPIDQIDQILQTLVVTEEDKEVVDTEEGMSRKDLYHLSWHWQKLGGRVLLLGLMVMIPREMMEEIWLGDYYSLEVDPC
jgi:hypothetical protein